MPAPTEDSDRPPDPPVHRDFSMISPRNPCHPEHKASPLKQKKHAPGKDAGKKSAPRTSATWATSSVDLRSSLEEDEVDERLGFVHAYNRLARKVNRDFFGPARNCNQYWLTIFAVRSTSASCWRIPFIPGEAKGIHSLWWPSFSPVPYSGALCDPESAKSRVVDAILPNRVRIFSYR